MKVHHLFVAINAGHRASVQEAEQMNIASTFPHFHVARLNRCTGNGISTARDAGGSLKSVYENLLFHVSSRSGAATSRALSSQPVTYPSRLAVFLFLNN